MGKPVAQLLLAQEALVDPRGRAEQAARPDPRGEISLATVDQPARVEAPADLDHLSAEHSFAGKFGEHAEPPPVA